MSRISRDRALSWANKILELLYKEDDVELFAEDIILRKTILDAILEEFKLYEELREKAKEKIKSQKREIIEGSREWDILLSKYFNEELQKLDKIFD